jgi:uncharacterized protein YuzE
MSVQIGPYTFDRVRYDAEADVLYLAASDPARAVDFDETPEGHAVSYDADGVLVGLTLIDMHRLLEEAEADNRAPSDGGLRRAEARRSLNGTSWSPTRLAHKVGTFNSHWGLAKYGMSPITLRPATDRSASLSVRAIARHRRGGSRCRSWTD